MLRGGLNFFLICPNWGLDVNLEVQFLNKFGRLSIWELLSTNNIFEYLND